jgi:hypothetical protein
MPIHTHKGPSFDEKVSAIDYADVAKLARVKPKKEEWERTKRIARKIHGLQVEGLKQVLDLLNKRGITSSLLTDAKEVLDTACNGSATQAILNVRRVLWLTALQIRLQIDLTPVFEGLLDKASEENV